MAYPNYYQGGYYPQYQNGSVPDMLNQYKGQYQPQMQMQMPIQQMPQQVSAPSGSGEFLWVLGEVEATSYPVAPNSTVTLWDKNQPTIYIKSANAQGVPSMRILDFTERAANAPKTPENHVCKCGDKFILKEDLNAVEDKIQDVMCRLSDIEEKYGKLTAKPAAKTTKKTEDE